MSHRDRRRDRLTKTATRTVRPISAWVVFAIALLVFNANLRTISAGDNIPNRFIPIAAWGHGTLTLDPVREAASIGFVDPFWLRPSLTGDTVSGYPIVFPVLATPAFAPAVAWLSAFGWTERRLHLVSEMTEKAVSSCVAAASVALLYLFLRRRTTQGTALLLSFAFAFATNTWVTSSQGMWQQSLSQLLFLGLLLLSAGEPTRFRALAAGALTGLHVLNRPFALLLSGPLVLRFTLADRRKTGLVIAGALAVATPFVLWNLAHFGHPLGYYGTHTDRIGSLFSHPVLPGLAGLLVSPSKGLVVFSPFFLFLADSRVFSKEASPRSLDTALALGPLLSLIFYSTSDIRAGFCYGPRFLVDSLPALVVLLVPAVERLRGLGRALFLAAVLWGVAVQAIGAFRYPLGGSDLLGLWDWRHPAFVVEARSSGEVRRIEPLE